jgi:formylglycine-generating enzyme required for sulfatase activity
VPGGAAVAKVEGSGEYFMGFNSMRGGIFSVAVIVAAGLVYCPEAGAWQGEAAAPKRVALLVGVNHYEKRGFIELKWPENDVEELGAELKRLGFDKVVVMKGSFADENPLKATSVNIPARLKELLAGIGKDDVVCVVLSGHGQQITIKLRDGSFVETDFYCPADAVSEDPETMVAVNVLTDDILRKRGGKNLLLIDACRDNPAENRKKGIQGRVVSLPEDTAILFSCRAGQKSEERDILKHSVFTHAVIETLRASTGNVLWSNLVGQVQERVFDLNPNQEPILAGAVGRIPMGRSSPTRISSRSLTNSIGMTFALIPAGEFMMGSDATDPDAYDAEFLDKAAGRKEKHRVRITRAFYLGAHEVTRGQFRRFVDETNYQTEGEKDGKGGYGWNEEKKQLEQNARYTWRNAGFEQTDEHPVVNVSWNDARAFADWLSRNEGKTYHLPTEAEWEYACRAGTNSRYSSGEDPEGLAAVGNIADGTAKEKYPDLTGAIAARDGYVFTSPVGRFRPNGWGLYDMHGNVWEWCSDGYRADYYKQSPLDDPAGVDGASDRVLRGGGWDNYPRNVRSAERSRIVPGNRSSLLGFRVALVQSAR